MIGFGWVRRFREWRQRAALRRLLIEQQCVSLKHAREEARVMSETARGAASNRMSATDELRATLQTTLDRVAHRSFGHARR